MKIIDSQIHAWYPNTPERPWASNSLTPHLPEFPVEQVLKTIDDGGVDRCIIVPVSCTGFDNEYSLAAARANPDRLAVMGRFDPDADDAREQLAGWLDQEGMLGIRHFFSGEPWMSMWTDDRYAWFWRDAEELQIPIMCLVPGNMKSLHPIMERHPELKLIIDHAGRHPRGPKDEAAWSDIDDTLHFARFRNAAIKVSSLPSFSSKPYPFPSLHKPVRQIYDTFGPQRMMWGSDITRLDWGYADNLRLIAEALDFLNEEDKEWVLGKTAATHCGWPL
ncbi:MAG TPA: amidohydrolase family protein [Bryobacteraceae bacterium]